MCMCVRVLVHVHADSTPGWRRHELRFVRLFFFSLLFNRQPFQLLCCPSFRLFLIDAASQFFSCYPIRAQFGLFNPLRVFLERYTEQRASTL